MTEQPLAKNTIDVLDAHMAYHERGFRSVMAPAHLAQKQMPVSRVGPLTTRAGVTFGLRDRRCACTASNVA